MVGKGTTGGPARRATRPPDVPASPAAIVLDAWERDDPRPMHRRLGSVLEALQSAGAAASARGQLGADTLGDRNRRILELHREIVATPLEASVTCAACGVASEFPVPVDAILALPAAERAAEARIGRGGQVHRYRLPSMADLDEVAHLGSPAAIRAALLARCRVSGGDGGPVSELEARRVAARFEELDPAASIEVGVACSGCGASLSATVDVATFVGRELDRFVEALFIDLDAIARTYGWDEATILALPTSRRRRYVEMIRGAGAPRAAVAGWR